jgi:NADH:ubiquinone oxidoreductase subunit F (NADH-binding)
MALSLDREETLQGHPALARRLLAGPDATHGFERLGEHLRRLRVLPEGGEWLLDELDRSGLRGRGGAWFPTARKWAAIAGRTDGRAVVVVNASEGEPLSAKDRTLLALRPHLVLDGAALAADTLGATEIVVYVSAGSKAAERVARKAIRERRRAGLPDPPMTIVRTADSYLAGESSAVVNRIMGGPATPRMTPPHVSEEGVGGRPTLVQNAETLANAALIARFGSEWFRQCGTASSPGSALMTVSGSVCRPGVYEVALGARIGDVLDAAGGTLGRAAGALLGGYFGAWLPAEGLAEVLLDADQLNSKGASLGCGVLAVLPEGACGLGEAARILAYLELESAGQCGPCANGLQAISRTMERVALSEATPTDITRLRRWSEMVRDRGACRHPDGAAAHLTSALEVFAGHLEDHLAGISCPGLAVDGFPQPPSRRRWWEVL